MGTVVAEQVVLDFNELIAWDVEAQVWVGLCFRLGVRSQGETPEEARLALASAVNLYEKHCRLRGLEPGATNAPR